MIATETTTPAITLHGGKGTSLLRLRSLGYNVPPFIIIEVRFFETLKDESGRLTKEQIVAACSGIPATISSTLRPDILFAVRSSAVVEDSVTHSFAGQFKTMLGVPAHELAYAIAEVWLSGYAAPVAAYKASSGIEAGHSMAVIIQEMIPAETAGVGFGINPLTGATDTMVINAVRGLGEALVSGEANADTYEVKQDGRQMIKLAHDEQVLAADQITRVAEALRQLEKDFGSPQDIEFAWANGQFYLLQSRPITTHKDATQAGAATVWDNSNIVESYPGMTLPLTCSFIEKMYDAVYRQFSLVLGVSRRKVANNSGVFTSMLGLLNGRVYYNLNSWYAALALLPGYSINARYMEGMMGVKEPPPVPVPPQRKAGLSDYLDVVRAVFAILGNLVAARRSKDDFIRQFDEVYNRFHTKDFSEQAAGHTWRDYTEFEMLMVARWKAPLVNDFFAMIYFGLLKKLTAKYLPEHPDLHNELIGASKDIITTQPLKLLPQLSALLTANEALRALALYSQPDILWSKLQSPEYSKELNAINEYLRVWGERCIAELKLETITYVQEPTKLIAILQSYIRGNVPPYREPASDSRLTAEAQIAGVLCGKWLRKRIFRHVLGQARYFVSNRENLRYYRTRGFGLVRRMMLGIGGKLAEAAAINEVRDIFYLRLDEVERQAHNPMPVQEIIAARKAQYGTFTTMPLPERIITNGILPEYIIAPPAATGEADGRTENVLQGIPCSAGVVRAKIRLVQDSGSLSSLEGCIMATYATDPGYVVLFPTVTGILTERGSLLSHAAIVSREMSIPCIVGIPGLMHRLRDGDEVVMDGRTGIVQIISVHEQP